MNGISISKMVRVFEALAPELERMSGGPVHLVRLIGSRVSFMAGRVPDEMPFVVPVRVVLNDEWAVLCYTAPDRHVDREAVKRLFEEKTHGS